MTKELLWDQRTGYSGTELDVGTVDPDPIAQFRRWFREAEERGEPEVNAMTLATADEHGRPSARIVLLKEIDPHGLVFYTNYESRKAVELERNPRVALLFYWHLQHRQIRVEGSIERVSAAESDAYFASRPRDSRIGALASPQSRVIDSRGELETRVAELEREYDGAEPPRPAWWGGYRVVPSWFELWQGQPSRLHDRISYALEAGTWVRRRLAP